MAQVVSVSSYQHAPLDTGWELLALPPGAATEPAEVAALALDWLPAPVPGTAAAALQAAGQWDLLTARNFDATEWWYRCRFAAAAPPPGCRTFLRLDGLATVAEVWCNGVHLLRSDNMYLAHALDVSELLRGVNEIYIRFHSLSSLLQQRRPRPRWRTRLVEQQQLRWFRTTLLGRMPGWCPPVAPVGPWRAVTLEQRRGIAALAVDLRSDAGGRVQVALSVQLLAAGGVGEGQLLVGDCRAALHGQPDGERSVVLSGELRVPEPALWWPHTHGAQPLYGICIALRIGAEEILVDCGQTGFRAIALERGAGDDFALHINGVPIFCRGACWTPLDIVRLSAPAAAYQSALLCARAAGMNMLRLAGNMIYEDSLFYTLCDQLGILVWQEFMLANMDYPESDPGFVTSLRAEAAQLLDRLQPSPALALLCGGSEVEQQAAMLGLPRECWSNSLFQQVLPELCAAMRPDVPYWPASPSGGELPFQVNAGVAHYYGVGAYLRPLSDARRSEVRFAAECLAFANVPEESTLVAYFASAAQVIHHPQWKARVPRDAGAGWDFEDVRDHYLRTLFGVDPVQLRWSDTPRYLLLSRIVTGEVMAAAFAEWRRRRASCHGALVWLYRDLWPGAGWGVIDAMGTPKAAYYYLRRALQPLCLFITDEGLNGLYLHVVNETAQPRDLTVRLELYRAGEVRVAEGEGAVSLPARGAVEIPASRLFPGFLDTSYAYHFGPPAHDLAVARLLVPEGGEAAAAAFYFPLGPPSALHAELGLTAEVARRPDGAYALAVRTARFAQSVFIDAPGYLPQDNYFHLEPGGARSIVLHPQKDGQRLAGTLTAANTTATPLRLEGGRA